MEAQNYLGIYLSKDSAVVVCLGSQGLGRNVLGCFSVSVEEQEEANWQVLASLIAQGCAERGLEFSEVAVALDCAMFMQHNVHSEFDNPKQIAQTIRFDTEEALATDITNVAIAFKITSSDQTGSGLTVFTAQRKVLSDVLHSLQSNNIDPVTIEPDVNCLSRFICRNVSLSEDLHPIFGMLSRRNGYFIVPHQLGVSLGSTGEGSHEASIVRTFLIGPTQTRTELLIREVPVTTALVVTGESMNNCLKVFDSTGSVDYQQLGEKLGVEVGGVDLAESAGTSPEVLADCDDPVDFAIAYGAALAHLEKAQSINFRNDFSPFQGRKVRLQKKLRFSSVSVIVLLLAVGLYFQLQLLQKNKYRGQLRDKFEKQYSSVMFGKRPPARTSPAEKLAGELRRIRNVKSPQLSITGEESISTKLTLVLAAFNKCAAQTDLNIKSISITAKAIRVEGDTSSRRNTLKLRQALVDSKLGSLQERLESIKGGRDSFSITIVPGKK